MPGTEIGTGELPLRKSGLAGSKQMSSKSTVLPPAAASQVALGVSWVRFESVGLSLMPGSSSWCIEVD